MNIAVVSCASKKADYTCSAYEMYSVSNTFKTQAELASKMYDKYYIMSAKYGIISPDKEIEPYNLTLHTKRLTTGNLITEEAKIELKSKIKKQLDYLISEGCEIDFHLSNDYYNLLSSKHQNHPKITHIKPQKLQSVTVQLYKEGIEKFDKGETREEVVHYLSTTIKTGNEDRESEKPSWWYHPIEEPFWGRSHELAKKYRLNDGNLFMHYHQDTVQSKHVMGWTNQLDNLKQLKQTDSESWRICGKNDTPFVTEDRLQEIELYKQNNPPKETKVLDDLDDLDNLIPKTKPKSVSSFINKNELQSTISKYYLNGLVESVKWTIEDNALEIDFQSPNKDMIGRVQHAGFPLENSEFAVYDTSKLNKLLGITSGEVVLELEKVQSIYTKLIISDLNYTLNFSLTDLLMIQDVGNVTDPDNYEIVGELGSEEITAIVRAHSALESDNVIVKIDRDLDGEDILVMSFGDNSNHTNKIDYQIPNATLDNVPYGINIPFNSALIKTILNNNKDAELAILKVNSQGLMKLEFEGEDWKSFYYIIRKADV